MEQQTTIAKTDNNSIKDWLQSDSLKGQIAQALPSICKPDRFLRVLLTSMQRTPKLMQCSKASLMNAFITCSQLGIEPDGMNAYLIPYGTTCQLIIGYKGLVKLALRGDKISNIHADVVCENDIFEYDLGEIKTHKIDFKNPRGKMYLAYAIATFKDGTKQPAVLTKEEIDDIRKLSKSGNTGPWKDFYNEMAKKTAFKRLSKWLPLNPEVQEAIAKEDEIEFAKVEVVDSVPPAPKLFTTPDDFEVSESEESEAVNG